ncbi:MAG: cobyrinate a,c-diamide synthase [Bacillota bacterium]
MKYPRLVIAGVHSGVGKTTLTLGLIAALRRQGVQVQPFKVGPDYIDPGLHFRAAGVKSHNLDSWMGLARVVETIFIKNAPVDGISVIEGVMGLYDGARGERLQGSTAHIALILKAPVVLVVNARGMGGSCAALVKGYMDYEPGLALKGVILNNAGSNYYKIALKKRLEEELGVKVLGCIPKTTGIVMPERHLGLLPAEENKEISSAISLMADLVESEIDLESLLELAGSAPCLEIPLEESQKALKWKVTLGVARDEAFSFYYQDSLDYLKELGAEIVFFSPLGDKSIPPVDGLYIGGGFPEMFLAQLSGNIPMINSLQNAEACGMPIYAECGGFMYLTKSIRDFDGRVWPGAGLVPAEVQMTKRLAALGYVQAKALKTSVVAEAGDVLKGHEFHYSEITGLGDGDYAFSLVGGKGADHRGDGYAKGNLAASYVHLHLRSNPRAAFNLLEACRKFREVRLSQ